MLDCKTKGRRKIITNSSIMDIFAGFVGDLSVLSLNKNDSQSNASSIVSFFYEEIVISIFIIKKKKKTVSNTEEKNTAVVNITINFNVLTHLSI